MARTLRLLLFVLIACNSLKSQVCVNDTVFSDILFVIDNSMSIDSADYVAFEDIIVETINKVQANCPAAQVAVVHYGGSFGSEVAIEYNFSNTVTINNVNRQFCTPTCIFDGGDDLNTAMDSIHKFLQGGELANDPNNALQMVIFTDASGTGSGPGMEDVCGNQNCSVIQPYNFVDSIKTNFNASVTVVGISDEADEEQLAVYASPGGNYTGPLVAACAGTFDGCVSNRKYIPLSFMDDVDVASDSIFAFVQCDVMIISAVVVDAGVDQTICDDATAAVSLTAVGSVGDMPYMYDWGSGLSANPSFMISPPPTTTTTYTVTIVDANDCTSTDDVTVTVEPCMPICVNDTIPSDVLFVVDNSMSISDANFTQFSNILLQSIQKTRQQCTQGRIAVMHYGGNFGAEVAIEYDFTDNPINSITRQFCLADCIFAGGDDLNAAMDSALVFLNGSQLSNISGANLQVVIFTDASGSSFPCANQNCSTIQPYTGIDAIKTQFGARVTVVGISDEDDAEQLAVYASTGGSYTGPLTNCAGTFDGCASNRKYVPVGFADNPQIASDSVAACIECQINIVSTVLVDAGTNQTYCTGTAPITLTATGSLGAMPYEFTWDNGLGNGAVQMVAPLVTTTYNVDIEDANGCTFSDQVTITVDDCGVVDCIADTIFSDVLFVVDNSMSISEVNYDQFAEIILQSATKVQAACSQSRIAVVHYGGAFGAEVAVEYDFGDAIDSIRRQFCLNGCLFNGGDDLNSAITSVASFLNGPTLSNNLSNNLQVVIFTDASGSSFPCGNQNCSVIRPYTGVDLLKTQFNASVSVVGISDEDDAEQLAVYASTGGSYTGPLHPDCAGTIDGCASNRKYVPISFVDDPGVLSDSVVSCVQCQIQVIPDIAVDAGPNAIVCTNASGSTTISATPVVGLAPFTFIWDNGLDSVQSQSVSPVVTTTYRVTMTDANMCTATDSVTVTPTVCTGCLADAGVPIDHQEICADTSGMAEIFTDENIGIIKPTGYEEVYILSDASLTIIDFNVGKTTFTVDEPGLYRVHTLIAEVTDQNSPDFLDLDIINVGESNLFLVVNCITDHGVCADFDFPGRVTIVLGPEDHFCKKPENSINLCSDGIDNDQDGLVDCADDDCADIVNCEENTLIACNDLFDNDLDGLVDCFDPDCFQFVKCFEREEDCGDGIDNDGDGLVDCADSSCAGSIACQENTPFTCIDGKDNDSNGLLDCEEPACQRFLVCAEANADACQDGIDNDFDGLIDCADADCRKILANICVKKENTAALCSDGLDNDGDGLVDCVDNQCQSTTACQISSNSTASFSLNLTVFLEGALRPDEDKMSTELNKLGYLPGQEPNTFFGTATDAGQPYDQAPWFYDGSEGANIGSDHKSNGVNYDEDVVDWVLISLRTGESKETQVWLGAGMLYNDGHLELSDNFPNAIKSKEFFIVIEHRNHLPIMSRTAVPIANGTITYDFSVQDSYSTIMGIGQIQSEGGRYMMIAGNGELVTDLSSDVDINARDLSCWLQSNGANSSYFLEDYDMNGDINIKDRVLWQKNNGLFSTMQTK